MAIEKRERTHKDGRRKVYRYRVKWRFKGTGPWQSKTVDNYGDAEALDRAVAKRGYALFSDDAEVTTLSIIGARPEAAQEAQNEPLTVAEAVADWIGRPGLSKASRKGYRTAAKRLDWLGAREVSSLAVADLNRWFTQQEDAGLSSNYRLTMRIVLNGALVRAGRPGLLEEVPTKALGKRKVKPYYLQPEQVESLIEAAERRGGPSLALAIRLTVTCGLRWGETYGLRVRYIDVPGRMVHIEEGINNGTSLADGWSPVPLKTETSIRKVPIPAGLATDLAAHIKGLHGSGPVFRPVPMGRLGNRAAAFWTHRTFHYNWKAITRDAEGVPDDLRYHDLRHTAAKNWLEAGVPIGIVSRMLGHSKIDVTHREYGGFDNHSLDIMRRAMGA